MAKYQVTKHRLGGWRVAFLGLLFAACGETATVENGSETHFLLRCSESCSQGFECLSGVCTRDCEVDADCSELSSAAVCADAGQGCRVFCDTDQDCADQNEDWVCDTGQCVWGEPPVDPPECPLFDGGVQEPSLRETSYAEIPNSGDATQAVADETGLFWQTSLNSVLAFVDSEVSELHPPTLDDELSEMGILTDNTHVYFAEAGPAWSGPPEEPRPPLPPGRLYSVPKAGGSATLLLELEDEIMTPLGVTEQGVVILSGERLYMVDDDGVELLEHIPPLTASYDVQVDGGRAYWSNWASVREPTELFAADLDGGEPEVVTEINGTFTVGHGRVLWKTETVIEDPLVQVEELFMLELDTGCITELPSRGESMGTVMLDKGHVYWKSFNSLGNSGEEACLNPLPLIRASLTSGALEELAVEGFDVTLCTDLVTQNDDTLFMWTGQSPALLAIDKP